MNLDQSFIGRLRAAAKAYDAEKDPSKRVALGEEFDGLADMLSEGQLRQVVKILLREM